MSKKLTEIATELAASLISAASLGQAVATADIQSAVRNLNSSGESYPQSQLERHVAENIRKSYRPGISGSLK
ncbi:MULTISPECIES: hypothetical protein [unclassified Gordonia (in: high G+C Gram-positive bacteria)]|uniref:hypothetical protein n=1 Tax=unclassified Gordonia (in: high G+C Gram-positive bacteria) TaxID=2657482 RepID=UPI0019629CA4|nr:MULTISPECIES: hypothetical protein [unclassified Gordonia (in: high G+C Gram-positive bacteria)]MBN0974582.1 hypothetical protein [Gordonia sp. BP-119]MBN0984376.1 hypothetical protein [Gordonia sp. BP-94]